MRRGLWILLGVVVGVPLIAVGIGGTYRGANTVPAKAPAARAAPPTDRELRVVSAAVTIKRAAREPNSLRWDGVWANGDGTVVCLQYRGRNGFGGVSQDSVVFANGKASTEAAAWNSRCLKGVTAVTLNEAMIDFVARQR